MKRYVFWYLLYRLPSSESEDVFTDTLAQYVCKLWPMIAPKATIVASAGFKGFWSLSIQQNIFEYKRYWIEFWPQIKLFLFSTIGVDSGEQRGQPPPNF